MNLFRIASRIASNVFSGMDQNEMAIAVETTIAVERDGEEVELEIHGSVVPYTRNPYTEAKVEITKTLLNGIPWTGTFSIEEEIQAQDALADEGYGMLHPDEES